MIFILSNPLVSVFEFHENSQTSSEMPLQCTKDVPDITFVWRSVSCDENRKIIDEWFTVYHLVEGTAVPLLELESFLCGDIAAGRLIYVEESPFAIVEKDLSTGEVLFHVDFDDYKEWLAPYHATINYPEHLQYTGSSDNSFCFRFENNIYLFDRSSEQLQLIEQSDKASGINFMIFEHTLLKGVDRDIVMVDLDTNTPTELLTKESYENDIGQPRGLFTASEDMKYIAVDHHGEAYIYSLENNMRHLFSEAYSIESMDFSPDGRYLAYGETCHPLVNNFSFDNRILIYSVAEETTYFFSMGSDEINEHAILIRFS